jgi:WD40 repeat protein
VGIDRADAPLAPLRALACTIRDASTMARKPTDDAKSIDATLELCSDAGFSWKHALRAATFDHHGHLLGTDASGRHLRRWRLSDAVVLDDLEARIPFDLWEACDVPAQPLDADTVIFRCEERAIALLDARTLVEKGRVSLASAQQASVYAREGAVVVVEDRTRVRVLDPARFEERSRCELPMPEARWRATSSHGEHMIAADHRQTRVYDLRTGEALAGLGERRAFHGAIHDRTRTIGAVLEENNTALTLRSLDDDREHSVPLMHAGALVTVSVDGASWLCATVFGTVHCVDAASGALRWTRVLDGRVTSLSFSPDCRLVAACSGHRVAVLDAATGAIVRYGGPAEPVGSLYACDGAIVANPGYWGRFAAHLWAIDGAARPAAKVLRGAQASAAGRWIAEHRQQIERCSSSDHAAVDRSEVTEARSDANVHALAVAESGEVYASVWRVAPKRKMVFEIDRLAAGDGPSDVLTRALPKPVQWLHVAEDAGVLLACLDHKELFVIDRASGAVAYTIKGLKKPARRATCSRDARSVCAITTDGALAFFRDRELVALHKHEHPKDLCLARDEQTLFTAASDAIFEWDVRTGVCLAKVSLAVRVSALCVASGPDAHARTLYVDAEDTNLYRVTLPALARRSNAP